MNKFSLLGKGGEKNDCLFPLPDRAIGIGTDPNTCSIVYSLGKAGIAAFHCQLVPQQDGWTLTDYSDTGTWLNGKKITPYQAYQLKSGDVFYLASLENSFYFSEDKTASFQQGQPQNQWQPQNQNQWPPQNQNQWPPQNQNQWPPQNQNQVNSSHKESSWKEKLFKTDGRLNRKPYLSKRIPLLIAGIIMSGFVDYIESIGAILIFFLLSITLAAVALCLDCRRLHDLDKSWKWIGLNFIPLVGFIWLIYLFSKKGTTGPNHYGPDPLA